MNKNNKIVIIGLPSRYSDQYLIPRDKIKTIKTKMSNKYKFKKDPTVMYICPISYNIHAYDLLTCAYRQFHI